jgi:hypothetical protein
LLFMGKFEFRFSGLRIPAKVAWSGGSDVCSQLQC